VTACIWFLSCLSLCQVHGAAAARYQYQSPLSSKRKVSNTNLQCSAKKRIFPERRNKSRILTTGSSRSIVAFMPPSLLTASGSVGSGSSIPESTLWLLRIGSALTTYVGALAFFDRPQGKMLVDASQDIEVRDSTVQGAGLGLFAKTTLRKGTILGTYPGAVLPLQQNLVKLKNYPPCEGYIWRFSDNKFVLDPTNAVGVLDPECVGGNPSMPGSLWLFENILSNALPTISTALCRINEPPLGRDVNVVTDENRSDRTVTFQLERDVYEGEEFFIDYGFSYDRSFYGK
jgi:hypothetical protein